MKILGFVVSLVLFIVGILALGFSFNFVGLEPFVFVGGILLITVALMIPVHVMKRVDP